MSIRVKGGKLEWRFMVDGHLYSHITDLADTPRNRTAAMRLEAEARRLVALGKEEELRIQAEPFNSAADSFITWAMGEYSEHANSWMRLRGSMSSAKEFWGRRPLASITKGDIEDYKSMRRTVHKVREVSIRHDLHALSVLFQYGMKHQWCRNNPIEGVEIPSDKDSVRMNVLSPKEEAKLFMAIDALVAEKEARRRTKEARALRDIRDLATLMLNQGCRPEELRELRQGAVDLEHGTFTIVKGKSDAARRTLPMTLASRDVLVPRLQEADRWVFPSRRLSGRRMGQHQRMWKTIAKRAGMPYLVPYDLRHTFATRAVESGVPLPELMAILGHANLRSIMKYVHMNQSHIARGMRTFEKSWPNFGQTIPRNREKTGVFPSTRKDVQ